MSDLFDSRAAAPMLIGRESGPFDDPDSLFELKLDGERCLAYIDRDGVELRNKRNNRLLGKFPELAEMRRSVNSRCILDGELTVFENGQPSFHALMRRIMLSGGGFKAVLAAHSAPACFTAFDLLYRADRAVTDRPLLERKALLQKTVVESELLALSRFVEGRGTAFYELAKARGLEGIVAKRRDSLYHMGRRTTDWVKIKNMQDDDFVVCGYIPKEGAVTSLVLGQYRDGALVDKGHVTLGVSGDAFERIARLPRGSCPLAAEPKNAEGAVWLKPSLVCTVKFMHKTRSGGLRQPVFKGLRTDKKAVDCVESDGIEP